VKTKIQWNLLLVLPKFFWVLCSTQVLQNAAVGVYSSNLADMQVVTRGTKELAAGYNSSLQGIIPIVLTPLTGLFFDKVGWRCIFISWTAALYVIVFALVGLTRVHPLAPILISSFALSTNAITFNACIPVLVGTQHLMGTAFGVWRAFVRSTSDLTDGSKTATPSFSKWRRARSRTAPVGRTTASYTS
jgi:MFS family permease